MRQVTVMIPAILLGGLVLFSGLDRRQERAETSAPLEQSSLDPEPVHDGATHSIVWLSHDWIEVPPDEPKSGTAWRRSAFGLDRGDPLADCVDPNCRACLIDLVYGREF